jgi:hypothetical protein
MCPNANKLMKFHQDALPSYDTTFRCSKLNRIRPTRAVKTGELLPIDFGRRPLGAHRNLQAAADNVLTPVGFG